MTTRLSVLLIAVTVAATLVGAAPAHGAEFELSEPHEYIVETRYGRIYLEAIHPVRAGKIVRAPAILTYSPYSILGRNGDADHWVPRGYVRIHADLVGTGNSGGCWAYGGEREKITGRAVVEWIARRKWSTGKIAMTGGSYNGTTAIATAVMDPPHLTTIVPEAAISRWYEYAFSGGIRYAYTNEPLGHEGLSALDDEGADTPLAFDFGLALPPPLDAHNEDWAERVASTIKPCGELRHTEHGYDSTPDYRTFWLRRDYVKDAHKVDIPVLLAHNWGDWNVKQEEAIKFYRALDNAPVVKLYMGSRWDDHGVPAGDYSRAKDAWMDHYLKGVDNGVQNSPKVVSQSADSEGRRAWYHGPWPDTKRVDLKAQFVPATQPGDHPWMLLPRRPVPPGPGAGDTIANFLSTNVNTESHAAHHARMNHDWFWFETPVLRRNVRIFGEPKIQIYSKVDRRWITFTPSIVDVDPEHHQTVAGNHVATDPKGLVAVTRGWLDSRYRTSLARRRPIEPGKPFSMTVVAKPQDYVFKKGHYIGLNIQTEINEWSIPKPYPCDSAGCVDVRILWSQGKTRLVLPVVNAPDDPMKLFRLGHH